MSMIIGLLKEMSTHKDVNHVAIYYDRGRSKVFETNVHFYPIVGMGEGDTLEKSVLHAWMDWRKQTREESGMPAISMDMLKLLVDFGGHESVNVYKNPTSEGLPYVCAINRRNPVVDYMSEDYIHGCGDTPMAAIFAAYTEWVEKGLKNTK